MAERAARYAAAFGAADEARVAGLLHDLGKYGDLFAARLEGRESGLDHWSAGAWAAGLRYRAAGRAAALAVQGHHVGLGKADGSAFKAMNVERLADRHPLGLRLTETDVELLLGRLEADGLSLPELGGSLLDRAAPPLEQMLAVRLLFSALVDADFVETEAHFAADEAGAAEPLYRPEGPPLWPERALEVLLGHVEKLAAGSDAAPEVLAVRRDLLAACRAAADGDQGLYTLTAPTGSGKTLAMLAFALGHAARHGLRRIVFAIPYLTIIEQTAAEYRRLFEPVFGRHYVLEHHSLSRQLHRSEGDGEMDDEAEARRVARQLAENWDAPLVVTTNVQLLESCFAHRPARCRKLHRLAGSVVLFDETQTLPPKLAVPTLGLLGQLEQRFGATVVFATATQPAFDHLDEEVRQVASGGWSPTEIVPAELDLFGRLRRTRIAWEHQGTVGWPELASRLAGHRQVLAIVNLKRHALELTAELRAALGEAESGSLFHLSTNLCPVHREEVLGQVRQRLAEGEPCRLVSTQCVEAGVDLDFPSVFRAFGPLEAIAQAAGRCNRGGKMPEPGEVVVFRPEDEGYPPGAYEQAAESVKGFLEKISGAPDLDQPETFVRYYRELYDLTGITELREDLANALEALDFARLAALYRLIEADTIEVVVPHEPDIVERLREEIDERGHPTADWLRRARPHSVSLYRPRQDDPRRFHLDPAPAGRGERSEELFFLADPALYDPLLGLVEAQNLWIA